MAMQPRPLIRNAGFTLIELLVVLAIMAALSIAFVNSLGSKSPRAVKAGLLEFKSSLQEARQAAIAGGRQVNLVITTPAIEQTRLQAFFTQPDGTIITDPNNAAFIPPVVDRSFEKTWRRYATFSTSDAPVAGEVVPIKTLPALVNFGFTGWSTPLSPGDSKFGFSTGGFPQTLTGGGTGRAAIAGGTWLAIVGTQANRQGRPYGGVFITADGKVLAFYKPDALLDTDEYKWQRME